MPDYWTLRCLPVAGGVERGCDGGGGRRWEEKEEGKVEGKRKEKGDGEMEEEKEERKENEGKWDIDKSIEG